MSKELTLSYQSGLARLNLASRAGLVGLTFCVLIASQGCAFVNATMDRITSVKRYDGQTPLDPSVLPQHYTLKLEINPLKDTFAGRAILTLGLSKKTRLIPLHAGDLSIESVNVEQDGIVSQAEPLSGPNGGLLIRTAAALEPGDVVVTIRYTGRIQKRLAGLRRIPAQDGQYLLTQTKFGQAQRIFPCMNHPALKAPIKLYLTIPNGWMAVANKRQVETKIGAADREIQFAESQPMEPDMLMFAIGKFAVTAVADDKQKPAVRVVTTEKNQALASGLSEAIGQVIDELSSFFGHRLEHKLDLLALPNLGVQMMDAPGLFVFRDTLVLRAPDGKSSNRNQRLMHTLRTQLSRRWIGHSVSMESRDDLWLYEGLVVWMRDQIGRSRDGLTTGKEVLVPWLINSELIQRPAAIKPSVVRQVSTPRPMSELALGRVYALVSMIDNYLGKGQLKTALKALTKAKQNNGVSAKEILSFLDAQSGSNTEKIAKWYLNQTGVPLVRMSLKCDGSSIKLVLAQERARGRSWNEPQGNPWTVPVCVRYGDGSGHKTSCHLLDTRRASFDLPTSTCPQFLHGNANNQGLYLWKTDLELFEKTVTASDKLTVGEQNALPYQLLSLLLIGEIESDTYSEWLAAVSRQGDDSVLNSVVDSLSIVRRVAAEANQSAEFQNWLAQDILGTQSVALRTQGPIDRRRLRIEAVIDRTAPDESLKTKALSLVKNPHQTTARALTNTLLLAATQGDKQLWNSLAAGLKEKQSQPVIQFAYGTALGAFRNQALLVDTLMLARNGSLSPRSIEAISRSIHIDNRDIAWSWLLKHQDHFEQLDPGLATRMGSWIIRNHCHQDRLSEFIVLTSQFSQRAANDEKMVRFAHRNVESCVKLSRLLNQTLIRFLSKKSTE